jgi:hypothetical protein
MRESFVIENRLHRVSTQLSLQQAALSQRLSKRRIDCLWRSTVAPFHAALHALASTQPMEKPGVEYATEKK